jgi:ribonuclease-3 family protein
MKLPSGQALAYLGDAVYEVTLRKLAIEKGVDTPEKLHQTVASLTHAQAQSNAYLQLSDEWTESEVEYFKKGRNAPVSKKSRSVSLDVAHESTGFEAIFGALYLNQAHDRVTHLCTLIIEGHLSK